MEIRLIGNYIGFIFITILDIIIVTEATAENISHPTLVVLHIRRNGMGFCHHCFNFVTDTIIEIQTICCQDFATQVVSAIDMITDPGEATTILIGTVRFLLTTYVSLRMSENVGITATCKRVEDTTITEVDMGVAGNQTFECTTIDELTLGHVRTVTRSSSSHTRKTGITVQVDISAVFLIIHILPLIVFLTDSTHLATTEDLEGIAFVQVDGSTTPDL